MLQHYFQLSLDRPITHPLETVTPKSSHGPTLKAVWATDNVV